MKTATLIPTKTIITLTLLLALFSSAFASAALAEEYLYVDANGDLQVEQAATPTMAINEADDRMYNSGVWNPDASLTSGVVVDTDLSGDEEVYLYVSSDNELEAQIADTPTEAINEADDRKYNSGVWNPEGTVLGASVDVTTGTNSGEQLYGYIDANGVLRFESADTPTEAINDADNRKYNSGVIVAEELM